MYVFLHQVTLGDGCAGPASPGDADANSNTADQAAKHTVMTAAPSTLPISTNAIPDTAAGAVDSTPAKNPNKSVSGAVIITPTSGSARKDVDVGAARYAAPTASTAAKKTTKTNKRKTSKTSGTGESLQVGYHRLCLLMSQ